MPINGHSTARLIMPKQLESHPGKEAEEEEGDAGAPRDDQAVVAVGSHGQNETVGGVWRGGEGLGPEGAVPNAKEQGVRRGEQGPAEGALLHGRCGAGLGKGHGARANCRRAWLPTVHTVSRFIRQKGLLVSSAEGEGTAVGEGRDNLLEAAVEGVALGGHGQLVGGGIDTAGGEPAGSQAHGHLAGHAKHVHEQGHGRGQRVVHAVGKAQVVLDADEMDALVEPATGEVGHEAQHAPAVAGRGLGQDEDGLGGEVAEEGRGRGRGCGRASGPVHAPARKGRMKPAHGQDAARYGIHERRAPGRPVPQKEQVEVAAVVADDPIPAEDGVSGCRAAGLGGVEGEVGSVGGKGRGLDAHAARLAVQPAHAQQKERRAAQHPVQHPQGHEPRAPGAGSLERARKRQPHRQHRQQQHHAHAAQHRPQQVAVQRHVRARVVLGARLNTLSGGVRTGACVRAGKSQMG